MSAGQMPTIYALGRTREVTSASRIGAADTKKRDL